MRRSLAGAGDNQNEQTVFTKGGFSGMASNVIALGSTVSEAERRERTLQRDYQAAKLADQRLVKLATVSMEGWEREKEQRVRQAFDRIVEHGWYDRAESTLKAIELGHVNAVREHYAMRRDKIRTPALLQSTGVRQRDDAAVERNTISALEWADNVNALDELSRTTNLGDHFMGLMHRKVAAKNKIRARGAVAHHQ